MAETKRVTREVAGPSRARSCRAGLGRAVAALLSLTIPLAPGLSSIPATAGEGTARQAPPPADTPDTPPGIRVAPETPPEDAEAPAAPSHRAAPRRDDSERAPRMDEGCPYRGRQLELIV